MQTLWQTLPTQAHNFSSRSVPTRTSPQEMRVAMGPPHLSIFLREYLVGPPAFQIFNPKRVEGLLVRLSWRNRPIL